MGGRALGGCIATTMVGADHACCFRAHPPALYGPVGIANDDAEGRQGHLYSATEGGIIISGGGAGTST